MRVNKTNNRVNTKQTLYSQINKIKNLKRGDLIKLTTGELVEFIKFNQQGAYVSFDAKIHNKNKYIMDIPVKFFLRKVKK